MKIKINTPERLTLIDEAKPYWTIAAGVAALWFVFDLLRNPQWIGILIAVFLFPLALALGVAYCYDYETEFDARDRVVRIRKKNRFVTRTWRTVPFTDLRGFTIKEHRRARNEAATYELTLLTLNGPLPLSPLSRMGDSAKDESAAIRSWLRTRGLPAEGY